ncbi:MAG: MarR family transcriptional regulator [Acidimicrobiales bacterium]
MDRVSLAEAARLLETSTPRLRRAIDRLGIQIGNGYGRNVAQEQMDILRRHLGYAPSAQGLSRQGVLLLAALNRRPLGARSARALARSAGVSPTVASRLVNQLTEEGLIYHQHKRVAEGSARDVTVLRLNRQSPRWVAIRDAVRKAQLPASRSRPTPRRVPQRLRHHFWNASPSELELPKNSDFVAARLLRTKDPEALSWAISHLDRGSIRKVAELRGLDDRERGWIRHLSESP